MTSAKQGIEDEVPTATPATADLVCWLWAAIPPKDDRLHVARAADVLRVHRSTVYRWLRDAHGRRFNHEARVMLTRRAILRGRGAYLWPPLDPNSARRAAHQLAQAEANARLLLESPQQAPKEWRTNGAMDPFEVFLIHYPRAHVYGLISGRTRRELSRVRQHDGQIQQTVTVPNRYAARMLKGLVLSSEAIAEHVCIPPRDLIPTGRTETWHAHAGTVDLTTFLPQIPGWRPSKTPEATP